MVTILSLHDTIIKLIIFIFLTLQYEIGDPRSHLLDRLQGNFVRETHVPLPGGAVEGHQQSKGITPRPKLTYCVLLTHVFIRPLEQWVLSEDSHDEL